MNVIKRNGSKAAFDKTKIYGAIMGAAKDVENKYRHDNPEQLAATITQRLASQYEKRSIDLSVEEIQEDVERELMREDAYEVAKAYIRYRYLHKMARSQYEELMSAVAEKLKADNVQNQNANVDEHSFGGRVGEASRVVTKQYALEYCMSEMAKMNHNNNEIYIHDLDSYAIGNHNCLSCPMDDLLANGFNTRQTDVRPAQSINTAFQLVAVIFQLQSLQQFGGVSATHLDWTMVPYVRKSFAKHYIDGLRFLRHEIVDDEKKEAMKQAPIDDRNTYHDANVYQYAMEMTTRELNQAVEGMYHNLNTLQSRSGNQLPFSSINYGTCTKPEGRMVTKSLLEMSIKGVGKLHKTSIFPCGIFQCMKGVNRAQGDPNYDLFRLALKSTSLRLYPNYANVDWSGNAGYDKDDPRTYFSTMGCVDGMEVVTYRLHGNLYVESFQRMWERLKDYFTVKEQYPGSQWKNDYMDLTGVEIYDTENGFVNTERIIRNFSDKWVDVHFSNGRRLLCTQDHPLEIHGKGVVQAGALTEGDEITIHQSQYTQESVELDADRARLTGTMNADMPIPCEIFHSNHGARLAFLIGLIEARGKIDVGDHFDKCVQIGSTNKEFALQVVALIQSLGMPAEFHINNRESDNHTTKYKVEFLPTDELSAHIDYVGETVHSTQADQCCLAKVIDIRAVDRAAYSYDVTTSSEHFEVSGIYSHNCRTANGWDINGFGQLKDGRGNICPVTVILPTLAMRAKQGVLAGELTFSDETQLQEAIKNAFMQLLDRKIHEAKDMLIERFEWICAQDPSSARFMYENHTMAGYIPEEGIRSALKHGTLALGQLGLAETLQILIGCDHTTDKGMELAKQIEQLFKDRCAEFKQQYKLNFGVYYSPAENLCYTAMQKFKSQYGVIPHVSENEYFTNSIHTPVWANVDPFRKIDIESQLTGYSSAGCITYIELDGSCKNNIDALETIVNYAMDKDIPYFAINVPNDTCMDCGYTDEIGDVCPVCGGSNIQRLRRVTGYLTGNYTTAFNKGKQQEVEMRVKHNRYEI